MGPTSEGQAISTEKLILSELLKKAIKEASTFAMILPANLEGKFQEI